jgi:hypothetical protein
VNLIRKNFFAALMMTSVYLMLEGFRFVGNDTRKAWFFIVSAFIFIIFGASFKSLRKSGSVAAKLFGGVVTLSLFLLVITDFALHRFVLASVLLIITCIFGYILLMNVKKN